MAETEQFDAIIIGAGQAGPSLARAFAADGRRTAIIERKHVGGTCVNEGCTPTKTMVASAQVAYLVRRAPDYGVPVAPAAANMVVVRARKRKVVESFRAGDEHRLRNHDNLELIMGQATFTGPHEVEVSVESGSRRLTAPIIAVNAGCRPSIPDLPGLAGVPFLTSTDIMELGEVPGHLIVLGGGYVGLEFAQMFRRFGSRVSVIEQSGHVLGREDDDVSGEIEKILIGEGIDLLLSTSVGAVIREAGGISVRARRDGVDEARLPPGTTTADRDVVGSHLLVAAGRRPNTDRLGLEAAGVNVDERGFIKVDDRLETNVPGVYALGDINGGPAFTHISYDDYRILEANLIRGNKRTRVGRLVPYTVFIDPQLGRVGLSESQAREEGRNVRVAKLSMTHVARAIETDETRGFLKVIVDDADGQILGAAVLGMEGGEIMGALQIAMMGKVPYTTLRDAVFAHPTLLESLNNLFATLD